MAKFKENVLADMCAKVRRDVVGYAKEHGLDFQAPQPPGSDEESIAADFLELDEILSRLSWTLRDLRKRRGV